MGKIQNENEKKRRKNIQTMNKREKEGKEEVVEEVNTFYRPKKEDKMNT